MTIPVAKAALLDGKKGLIIGVANDQSIAWGCARAFRALGADLALTYLNDKAKLFVGPLAREAEASIFMPLDVMQDGQTEAVFKRIEEEWGEMDFLIHSIAFSPKEALHGRVVDVTREGFAKRWMSRTNFEWVRDHKGELGDLNNALQQQAFFVAGIMAYGRCYASSGPGIPTLDAKQVYQGSKDGMEVHERLIELRNTIAAHTDKSNLIRLTLAVKEEPERIIVRHLQTIAIPTNEIPDFLEAVEHTAHFVTVSLNKYLNHLQTKVGKTIELD